MSANNFTAAQAPDKSSDPQKEIEWVTFLSHRTGENKIYKMKPDGSEVTPIFGGPVQNVPALDKSVTLFQDPHWTRQSPDGQLFASWVYQIGKPYSKWSGNARPKLVVGDLAGTWTWEVNPDCYEKFAWSPDSKRLAFSIHSRHHIRGALQEAKDTTEIAVCGIDGSEIQYVLEHEGNLHVQDWSPDGSRLLIRVTPSTESIAKPGAKSELYEFRLEDSLKACAAAGFASSRGSDWPAFNAKAFLTKVEYDGELQIDEARYSPDGDALALAVYDRNNMYAPNEVAEGELGARFMARLLAKIAIFDLQAGTTKIIADYEDGIRGPICWSADGSKVMFSRYLPKNDDRERMAAEMHHGLSIWSVDRNGENAKFITTGWSPDCRRN